jgi:phenylpropionate dioxygenase-like ring-hydroxylating dioxygenase large terminal subunit
VLDQRSSAVPFAVEVVDRIPKERYRDPDFFALEAERLWPRVWQMACRLEQIPSPGDFAEYSILDDSVIVVRGDDGEVRAFQNACRHRGVRLVEGDGTTNSGFTCPFHGWCYALDGHNTFVPRGSTFNEHNLVPADLDLVPVRCETWGGCAWVNLDGRARPLRESIEPFATVMDAWHLDGMRAEWWYAFRLPVNWKLAEEAFMEQYHVIETHPQLRIPGRYPPKDGSFDPARFLESELHYLRVMNEGMSGMVHTTDVAVAERLAQQVELPPDPILARQTWERAFSDAVVAWHRSRGSAMPDLNELDSSGMNEPMGYCFPHFFVLPMYSSASSYRFRPLAPEETLMEIWSLTRYPQGEEPGRLPVPEPWAHDDPRVPPIPVQDFSNLPRQQRGLRSRGFEYMRLSEKIEGHISNYHRLIDGFLAGLDPEQIAPALAHVNVNPLDRPIVHLGL